MKILLISVALCALPLSAVLPPQASAQVAVYDPANHIQNIYQAIRSLQQVNQQIRQLTNEIAMLENMARDLETLPDSIADDILRRMQRIEDLMRDAEGIGYKVEEIEREYARMAMQYGQKARDIRKAYEDNEAVPELAAQIRKSKAFDWLLHHVDFVDPDGAPIDRDTLLGHSHDDEEHDHGDDDVQAAAAAVIAATDAAATEPNTDQTRDQDPEEETS